MRYVVLALVLGCAGSPPRAHVISAAQAQAAPPLEYRLLTGETWSARAAAGRVIVLDVWATFCKPCKKAFPKLDALAAAHPDVVVIGVSVDDQDAAVHAFLSEVPVRFAIGRDPAYTVKTGPLAISKLPTLIVVDRAGRLRMRLEEPRETDYDTLGEVVVALGAEDASP